MPLAGTAIFLLSARRSHPDADAARVHSLLLNALIRHAPGPVYVSVAAQEKADERGLGDLRDYHWNQQVKRMGDTGRKVFAWDHFYPVAELRRRLDALQEPTIEHARKILAMASIAWILKSEDRRLNELGYQHRRSDPFAAYAAAGIRLLHVST